MGRRKLTDQQAGFAGGLNSVSDPAFLRPDQARQMANFRLSNYGAALKRLGTALTTTAAITTFTAANVGGMYWPAQGRVYLFAASPASTALNAYRGAAALPAASVWSDLGALPQWRPVLFSDGTNEVMYVAGDSSARVRKIASNGTTITSLGATTAQVKGLCVYNDRLWGWSGNILYYSNLSSATGSTGGDSLGDDAAGGGRIVVRTFGAADIIACAPVNGSLLIFHAQGISVLTGWGQDDTQIAPQVLSSDVGMSTGTASALCVANTASEGNVAYFLSDLGAYATTGSDVRPLGTPDRPDPLVPLIRGSGFQLRHASVAFNRPFNEVWFYAHGAGIYVYNVTLGAWSGPFTGTYGTDTGGTRAVAFFDVLDDLGRTHLWRIAQNVGNSGLWVGACDYGSTHKDDAKPNGAGGVTGGTSITATLQLHRLFCSDRVFAKSFRWVNLLATLPTGDTRPTVVFSTPIGGATTHTLGALTGVQSPYYLSPGGQGAYLDATISDVTTTGVSDVSLGTVPAIYELADVQANLLGRR